MAAAELPAEVKAVLKDDEAVVVVDHAGNIVAVTEALRQLLDLPEDEYILGEAIELLVPADRRFGHQAYRRGYIAEPAVREMDPGLFPEAERVSDGALIPIYVILEPIRVGGMLYSVAHVTVREDGQSAS